MKQAPPIDDWKIIALKPAIGSGYTFEINGTRVSEEDSRFIPITEEDSPDAIAIQIIHPAMPAEGINDQLRTDLIMGIYSNLDSLLGERSVTLDVERLEFSSEISPEDKALPLSELISYINWKKKERSNYGVRFPEQTYAAYEGEVDGFVKMLMAVVSLNYYSYKPDYPYLNIVELAFNEIDESGFPVEDISEIQDVEAFISDRIRSTELGHHCLSDTGNGKREMWFYLKDDVSIDEILTQLREEMQSHLISYTTMYDPYWVKANEFIK